MEIRIRLESGKPRRAHRRAPTGSGQRARRGPDCSGRGSIPDHPAPQAWGRSGLDRQVQLGVTAHPHKVDQVRFARLKLSIGQPSAKQFMPEPHPIGVENVALAVLGNLPDVPVAVVLLDF